MKIYKIYAEVVDQNGKPISGIVAFQVYKDGLVIATKEKMYTNKPELFPGFTSVVVTEDN